MEEEENEREEISELKLLRCRKIHPGLGIKPGTDAFPEQSLYQLSYPGSQKLATQGRINRELEAHGFPHRFSSIAACIMLELCISKQ